MSSYQVWTHILLSGVWMNMLCATLSRGQCGSVRGQTYHPVLYLAHSKNLLCGYYKTATHASSILGPLLRLAE